MGLLYLYLFIHFIMFSFSDLESHLFVMPILDVATFKEAFNKINEKI